MSDNPGQYPGSNPGEPGQGSEAAGDGPVFNPQSGWPQGSDPATPPPPPPQPGQQYGGYPPQPQYAGYQGYGYQVPVQRPDDSGSTLAMVLGIVGLAGGLAMCGLPLVVSPFAWVVGHRSLARIRASNGALGGEGQARAGQILGIVGTVLLFLAVLAVVLFIVLAVNDPNFFDDTGTTGTNVGLH